MKIGLALSGGGFRATVFHLGVMARLAESELLESVTAISTVSGGSLCGGLIYAANNYRWPSSAEYRAQVVPHARRLMTSTDLQGTFIKRALRSPLSLLRPRASSVGALLREFWDINYSIKDLPDAPRWYINATCYETGKNWRFTSYNMGDYLYGYTFEPDFPLSDALAASAAFPGLIGPLVVDTTRWQWKGRDPATLAHRTVNLWDGGVYENLGVEALFKPGGKYHEDVDFLLTSDAGAQPSGEAYRFYKSPYRLIGLATDQIRSLRARMVVANLVDGAPGSYLQIDNSAAYLLNRAHRKDEAEAVAPNYLPESEVQKAAKMESTLRQLTPEEFERLFRHGFEVADVTMYAFKSGGQSELKGYNRDQWQ